MPGPLRRIVSTYADAYSGLPASVWWLALALLVNRAGTMVLPFLTLYLTRDIGMTVSAAGKLVAIYGAGAISGSALGGWLSDKVDPSRVQRWSLVLMAALMIALVGVDRPGWLAGLFFLVGLTGDAFRPAMMVAVTRCSSVEQRTRSFALMRLAANAGMAIGPATGGWLASFNYDLLFFVDAATAVGAAAVLWFHLRVLPTTVSPGEPETVAERNPFRDPPFLFFMLVTLATALAFFQVFTVLPLHLRDQYGLQESSIGSVIALNASLIVVFEMILLRKLERVEPLLVASAGGLALGAGLALLPLGPPLSIALAATVVWTLGEMLLLPISNVIVSNRAGTRNTGRYMGVFLVTFGLAFVAAPWLGTWVYETRGPVTLWTAAGALGLFVAIGCLALRPWLGQGANPDQREKEPSISSTRS